MSALEETLGLLDLTGMPCATTRLRGAAIITRVGGMQVLLRELGDGLIEIIYEQPFHDEREECEPARAAAIAREILSRKRLEAAAAGRTVRRTGLRG
jgi:hypothetical protein